MRRAHLLLPAALLSCAPAAEDSGAAAPPPAWLETVQARISAHARAIVPEGLGYAAALPGHPAVARFTDEGLILGEPGAAHPLELRFAAWGAAGAAQAVEPVAPTLGDCLSELLPEGGCARQLEYAHAGVTAWWVGLDRGVEFGWTVAAPPAAGAGELVFEVEVAGADWLGPAGEGAELVDASGEGWTVSGALAWGADGAPLPASLEVDGGALFVRVDAEGAAWPVTVDPVLEVATTALTGSAVEDAFGAAVAGAGDVNGDGYDDVIVGAPEVDAGSLSGVGAALVYLGGPGGVSSSASLVLSGAAAYDRFGRAVAGAGDVNGDGYDDVLIGAPYYDAPSAADAGAVYVHPGSSTGLSSRSLRLTGDGESLYFGFSVAAAGDVNGDGYDDAIIGAPRFGSASPDPVGAAYIYSGSSRGLSASGGLRLTGGTGGDLFGWSVSGAGDVNGDGYDDVIVGAPQDDYTSGVGDGGAAYVHHGSAAGVSAVAATGWTGAVAGDCLGYSVSGAGDVNGDGYGDVIVGACGVDSGALLSAGAARVHHGGSSGVSSSAAQTLTGSAAYDEFGASVSGAGDVNGDGYDDIIVGAPYFDSGALIDAGAAHLHHGGPGGVEASPSRTLPGGARGYFAGFAVSGAGDVNGDGYDDVLVGVPLAASAAGSATVHHGYADEDGDGVALGGDLSTPQDCDDADAAVGAPSDQHVDADGDGFGTGAAALGCPGEGLAPNALDCDDGDPQSHPGAAEVAGDGIDQDCDGADLGGGGPDSGGGDTADGDGDGGGGKLGCGVAPSAPGAWLGALLLLPALARRRGRG